MQRRSLIIMLPVIALAVALSFMVGAASAAQGTESEGEKALPKVQPSVIGYIDLARVMAKDKELGAISDKMRLDKREEERGLEKKYKNVLREQEKELRKHRAGDEKWIEIFEARKATILEGVNVIAGKNAIAEANIETLMKNTLRRIDAEIAAVSKEMGLDTVVKIRSLPPRKKPGEEGGEDPYDDEKRAAFRINAESILYLEPQAREITDIVIERLNAKYDAKKAAEDKKNDAGDKDEPKDNEPKKDPAEKTD